MHNASSHFFFFFFFLPQKDHSHAGDSGRRRTAQVVRLEQKVHVWTKLNSLPGRHRQQSVVIQHRVQRLDPLRVDVSVADNPRLNFDWFTNHLTSSIRQYTIGPLPSIHVYMTKQLEQEIGKY